MEHSEIEVNPYGTIFTGNGVVVEVATLMAKNSNGLNDILMKVTGAPAYAAGIDNRTIRYSTVPAGTGQNFNTFKGGEAFTRMTSRSRWGLWEDVEIYLDGKAVRVAPDEVKSKDARPLHLLTEYNSWLAEAPARLMVERSLADTQEKLHQLGWMGKLTLVWNGNERQPEALYSAQAIVSALEGSFRSIWATELGQKAMAPISAVEIRMDMNSKFEVVRSLSTLTITACRGLMAEELKEGLTNGIEKLLD